MIPTPQPAVPQAAAGSPTDQSPQTPPSKLEPFWLSTWFWLSTTLGACIGIARAFPFDDTRRLIAIGIIAAGAFLGYVLMSTHQIWLTAILSRLPGFSDQDMAATSALRSPFILLALPVMGIILIFSDSFSFGLGLYWGVWSWYAAEFFSALRGKQPQLSLYFPGLAQVAQDSLYHTVTWGFLVFGAAWASAIVLWR